MILYCIVLFVCLFVVDPADPSKPAREELPQVLYVIIRDTAVQ